MALTLTQVTLDRHISKAPTPEVMDMIAAAIMIAAATTTVVAITPQLCITVELIIPNTAELTIPLLWLGVTPAMPVSAGMQQVTATEAQVISAIRTVSTSATTAMPFGMSSKVASRSTAEISADTAAVWILLIRDITEVDQTTQTMALVPMTAITAAILDLVVNHMWENVGTPPTIAARLLATFAIQTASTFVVIAVISGTNLKTVTLN